MEKIPYPWLAFYEKMKTGHILLRDGTGVTDSMLLLFGGKLYKSEKTGHLHMQEGWLEFAMHAPFAETVLRLRRELDDLIYRKLENPKLDIFQDSRRLLNTVLELLHGDACEGRFWLPEAAPVKPVPTNTAICCKSLLNNRLQKMGYKPVTYTVKTLRNKTFAATVMVKGKRFTGKVASSKRQAEDNVAADALDWLDSLAIAKEERKEARKAGRAQSQAEQIKELDRRMALLNLT